MSKMRLVGRQNFFPGLVFAVFFLYFSAILVDHLYMVNGREYPKFLSTSVTVPSHGDAGIDGLTALCHGAGGWEFYAKDNGVFMRCTTILTGSVTRPKTYVIANYDQLANEPIGMQ